MRAAGRQLEQLDFPEDDSYAAQAADPTVDLKQEVAKRLAAHRLRRGRPNEAGPIPIAEAKRTKPRADRIASAVAERYAQSQSYRDYLAAEAARAIEEANAAAEIAARNAEAVTVAQQQLLAELDEWNEASFHEASPIPIASSPASVDDSDAARRGAAPIQHPIAGATVRLYHDVDFPSPVAVPASSSHFSGRGMEQGTPFDEEESFLLDDEIAFRQTPVFAEPAGPPIPIPANLIEFPRQLVAPRKARPRIAEGPLREEADSAPAAAQLRIFEVEPEQIATMPGLGVEVVVPEWSSIRLDAAPAVVQDAQEELQALLPLETASLNLRAMAAAVDGCILGATFLAAVAAFASRVAELPALPIASLGATATLLILFILYHLLFFTFSDATPGMRYARIGLCTFSDENPTRAQMRRRTWAILLSACPLGIGFLWALLDDDRLGWHDRISRMYQRGY